MQVHHDSRTNFNAVRMIFLDSIVQPARHPVLFYIINFVLLTSFLCRIRIAYICNVLCTLFQFPHMKNKYLNSYGLYTVIPPCHLSFYFISA